MKRGKVDLVRNWLEKALWDLMTAKNGLGFPGPFTDVLERLPDGVVKG